MKMKRLISLLLCLCFAATCLTGCSKTEKKTENVTILVNGKEFNAILTGETYCFQDGYLLCRPYQMNCTPSPFSFDDCREFTMTATEDTEKVAALLNYLAWDEAESSDIDLKLRSGMEAVGLSSENRLTGEWLENNLDLALELHGYVSEGIWLWTHKDGTYERIILSNSDKTE